MKRANNCSYIPTDSPVESEDSYSSSDDSECGGEMTTQQQSNACGSKTHKVLTKFFSESPVDETTFITNLVTIKTLYEVDDALWAKYQTACGNFKVTDSMAEKITKASAIADAAKEIRTKENITAPTVIVNNHPEVKIENLSQDEIKSLKSLHTVLTAKLTGSTGENKTKNPGAALEMARDFINDMKIISSTKILPTKWLVNNRIWKCFEVAKANNLQIVLPQRVQGEDPINDIVDLIEKHKIDEPAKQSDKPTVAFANKFSVDPVVCVISHYKKSIKKGDQSYDDFIELMNMVAAFTRMSSISVNSWFNFTRANKKYTSFWDGITLNNVLYDNPGKMTKARLFSCAGLVTHAYVETAAFGCQNVMSKIPKLICSIYKLDQEYNQIGTDKGTTSTSEHLLHLLLSLGGQFSYICNRNFIPKSVRDVKFIVDVSGN